MCGELGGSSEGFAPDEVQHTLRSEIWADELAVAGASDLVCVVLRRFRTTGISQGLHDAADGLVGHDAQDLQAHRDLAKHRTGDGKLVHLVIRTLLDQVDTAESRHRVGSDRRSNRLQELLARKRERDFRSFRLCLNCGLHSILHVPGQLDRIQSRSKILELVFIGVKCFPFPARSYMLAMD